MASSKLCFVIGSIEAALALNGLARSLVAREHDVFFLLDVSIISPIFGFMHGMPIRFWVFADSNERHERLTRLERDGYEIHILGGSMRWDAIYESWGVSPDVIFDGIIARRDPVRENDNLEQVHDTFGQSFIVCEGSVDFTQIPKGVHLLTLTYTNILDVCGILDEAMYLHSTGGPLLVMADVLGLKCKRVCHCNRAERTFPFRNVEFLHGD